MDRLLAEVTRQGHSSETGMDEALKVLIRLSIRHASNWWQRPFPNTMPPFLLTVRSQAIR